MPVLGNSAYVSVETVTNLIRAIANDMIYSQAGEILTDSANFMLPLLNDALEWFMSELANHGVNTFDMETVITPLTATQTPTDPATQVNFSDSGYFDGVQLWLGTQQQLPTNLLEPERLWERQTGSTEDWLPMTKKLGGLPPVLPSDRFRIWEWRQDAIYMPGAIQSNDIRLRYVAHLAYFVSTEDTLYFRGAVGAIAYYMVSTYLASKNPQASVQAESRASERVKQICTRASRAKQSAPVSRRSYGNPRGGTNFIPPHNS